MFYRTPFPCLHPLIFPCPLSPQLHLFPFHKCSVKIKLLSIRAKLRNKHQIAVVCVIHRIYSWSCFFVLNPGSHETLAMFRNHIIWATVWIWFTCSFRRGGNVRNFRGIFKPAAHFCISLLKAHSDRNNWQEQQMGRVQLLRGRERERASAKGLRVSVCVWVRVRSKIVQRTHAPLKSEDGSSSENQWV